MVGPEKLEKILSRFTRVKIMVIGDIMFDRFIWGNVSRISPEAPVPVVVVNNEDFLLGGAANVVNNIHSLGGKVSLCGLVGEDEMGQKILHKLNEIGIETDGIFMEQGRQTTVKTRIIAHQQQIVRIDRETTSPPKAFTFGSLAKFLKKNIEDSDGIILSDYGKGLLTRELIRIAIQSAKGAKKFVLVDPKPKNFPFYRGATVVTPNTKEASEAFGVPITDEMTLKTVGEKLLKRLRCDALVITRGEEGMTVFEVDQDPYHVPTVAKEVYDVTGAGDTVVGTMSLALGTGASIKEAARLANYAAGIVVGKVGTATVHRDELIKVIQENH